MKKQGFSAFLRRKQYVIAGAIVAIAAVGSTMLYSNAQEKEREQMEAELAAELQEEQLAAEEETAARGQDRDELRRLHRRSVRLRGRAGQLPADRRDEFRQPDAARAGPLRRHGLREGYDGGQPRPARDAL